MKETYFYIVVLIERLHRLFLDVIKKELDLLGIYDINNVQTLILYNLGKEQLTVGELTNKGYYLGSNVSYNLRKMVSNGYIDQNPSQHDRRSSYIKLSAKGESLKEQLDILIDKQAKKYLSLSGLVDQNPEVKTETLMMNLKELESFWKTIS